MLNHLILTFASVSGSKLTKLQRILRATYLEQRESKVSDKASLKVLL